MLLYVMIFYSYHGQSTLFLSTRREPVIFIHFCCPPISKWHKKEGCRRPERWHPWRSWRHLKQVRQVLQVAQNLHRNRQIGLAKDCHAPGLAPFARADTSSPGRVAPCRENLVLWENLPETMGLPMKYGGKACKIVPPLGNSEERALTTRRVIQKYMNHCESSSQRCLKLTEIIQRPNQNQLQNLSRTAFWLIADHFSRHFFAGPNSASENHISFRC